MKSTKHILASCLVLLAAAAAASCAAETTDETPFATTDVNTEAQTAAITEAAVPDRLAELGARDFSGQTYTVLDSNPNSAMHINIPGDTQTGELINDTLWSRDAFMEETYGITINYEQKTSGGASTLRASVMAGDRDYDLVIATAGGDMKTMTTQGILANLTEIEHLSPDQKWWSSLMYDSLRFNDAMYFTTGDITPTMYQIAACTFVNTKLADDYDITCDFVSEVREGTWTWDLVGELSKDIAQDLNQDGQWAYQDDLFGNIGCFSTYLIPGCAVDYVTLSDDGSSLSLAPITDRTVAVVEKLQRVFPQKSIKSEGNDFSNSAFKEDRALFLTHITESAAVHLRDMESDYLILPVAKYDSAQEGYRSSVNLWATAFVAVPLTAADEQTGFITEAMAYWSYVNMRPIAFDLTYKAKTVRDERSVEMLDIVFDNLYCSFADLYNFGGMTSVYWNILYSDKGIASEIEKISGKAEGEIQKFMETWGKTDS
ncbi:MAG: extracellular solute-binding protein [Clostridia bacterium]|nr:extracellular solute-binding protein [Clostridia bacterium]